MIENRLRRARETAGLSIGQAATRLGVMREALERIEDPTREPPADGVVEMAALYGVSVEWLIGATPLRDYDAIAAMKHAYPVVTIRTHR